MPTIKIIPFPGVPGPKGDTGEQGPRGYQGDPGATYVPTGANGTFISNDNKMVTVVNGLITTIENL
jgi:hypothetical protein